jgi:hypothetical protein
MAAARRKAVGILAQDDASVTNSPDRRKAMLTDSHERAF